MESRFDRKDAFESELLDPLVPSAGDENWAVPLCEELSPGKNVEETSRLVVFAP